MNLPQLLFMYLLRRLRRTAGIIGPDLVGILLLIAVVPCMHVLRHVAASVIHRGRRAVLRRVPPLRAPDEEADETKSDECDD